MFKICCHKAQPNNIFKILRYLLYTHIEILIYESLYKSVNLCTLLAKSALKQHHTSFLFNNPQMLEQYTLCYDQYITF